MLEPPLRYLWNKSIKSGSRSISPLDSRAGQNVIDSKTYAKSLQSAAAEIGWFGAIQVDERMRNNPSGEKTARRPLT